MVLSPKKNPKEFQLLKFATLRLLYGIQADKEHPNRMIDAKRAQVRTIIRALLHNLFHA
jgi:hypothetical protein